MEIKFQVPTKLYDSKSPRYQSLVKTEMNKTLQKCNWDKTRTVDIKVRDGIIIKYGATRPPQDTWLFYYIKKIKEIFIKFRILDHDY